MALNAQKVFDFLFKAVKVLTSSNTKDGATSRGQAEKPAPSARRHAPAPSPRRETPSGSGSYPGDYRGTVRYEYNPSRDGDADPGEIVWGWVPFEEDYSQGKDRPVLIIGRDGQWLLGLMLTSKDKNNSEHRNPNYLDIGTGEWDRERRDSEVKLDRIIRVNPSSVRREGAILDQARFKTVVNALNNHG
ncbi:hypothetical protein AUR04nite_02260 [Glutamicibacter uratoxydans]|uniref:mRNA interferase PemK n=1 Tax=Glutamicibacter uratoxydans TaxID=43667 RepID=A0A4Y4DLI8_GLUUR|nr:type II toxin-antitoxin system PemK/MazF family toxin [Glutamicibacter uratoxydans]GED04694.1 hypothetical protein AUR04nite_02260 [Glutamicibacter uratoxydans]